MFFDKFGQLMYGRGHIQGAARMLNESTVSAGYLTAIYMGVLNLGISEAEISAIPGLSVEARLKRPQRYPAQALIDLFQLAADHTGDLSIGARLGMGIRPVRQIDVIYATTFCDTLMAATELNFKYQPLIHEIGQSSLEIEGDMARCVFTPFVDDPNVTCFVTEAIFTGYALISQWLLWAQSPMFAGMRFRHSAPADTSLYKSLFGCEVVFDSDRNEAIIDKKALNLPIPGRNPRILKRLTKRLDMMMLNLHEQTSVATDCRSLVMSSLGHSHITIQAISKRMNMSERNLRRRLSEENMSFRKILEEARKEAAAIYLGDPKMSLSEVAHSLGYNDQSAFSRAFKLWFKQSPADYRRAL